MADEPKSPETPMQKALRLKKAALEARNGPPVDGKVARERAAAARAASKSKPWMTR